MGTTRKKHARFPQLLLTIADSDEVLNYGGYTTDIQHYALCFVWQDNSLVSAITTVLSLDPRSNDFVDRMRQRPRKKRIAKPVLGKEWLESISIYKAVDVYNYNKDLVENADQLRAHFTVHISQAKRIRRPLFYYLLDISFCNSYLI